MASKVIPSPKTLISFSFPVIDMGTLIMVEAEPELGLQLTLILLPEAGGGCGADAVILVESVALLAALSVMVRIAV